MWFVSNKCRHLIDFSTNNQRFKRLNLLLSNVEIEHFTPQWNASKLNIEYIFRENFAIHVSYKHSSDCSKTSFLLLFVTLPPRDIASNEKSWKSFILSFPKIWSLLWGNKFRTFSFSWWQCWNLGWFNACKYRKKISCSFFAIVKFCRVVFRSMFFTYNCVLVSGVLSLGIIVSHLSLSSKFLGSLWTFTLVCYWESFAISNITFSSH